MRALAGQSERASLPKVQHEIWFTEDNREAAAGKPCGNVELEEEVEGWAFLGAETVELLSDDASLVGDAGNGAPPRPHLGQSMRLLDEHEGTDCPLGIGFPRRLWLVRCRIEATHPFELTDDLSEVGSRMKANAQLIDDSMQYRCDLPAPRGGQLLCAQSYSAA